MTIDQLKYIIEVFETGSFTAAAKNLHISQPNISKSILNLEKILNVNLFNRSRLGAEPTEIGMIFIEKARTIIEQLDDLENIAQLKNNSLKGSLSLITIPIINLTILPGTLGTFKQQYPDVQIEVIEDGSQHAIESVAEGKADIGAVSIPNDAIYDPRIDFEPLITSKTIAYVGKHSPLAKKKEISLKEIIQYPLVLFNERYATTNRLRFLLQQYGTPNVLFTSSNSDAMRKVISESLAIGFYSNIALKIDPYILSGEIVPLKIIDEKDTYYTYGIITKKGSYRSMLTQKFINKLQTEAQNFKIKHELTDYSKKVEILTPH